jgi:uncharacterized protein (DUF934 family)
MPRPTLLRVVEPAVPPADTKDWTWVLQRPCPQCGFDSRAVRREDVPRLLADQVTQWSAVMDRPDVRDRPAPLVWSALEYGCHVRDVYRVFEQRLQLMLRVEDPVFDNWDQDATALEQRYHVQEPARVSAELAEAGRGLAAAFDEVADEDWERTGRRSDGAVFTVDTLARYALHDPAHHAWDVGDGVVTSG